MDHVWRWYELRHTQGIQAVNYFMLAAAILSAGYVSALTSKLYFVAGVIGMIGVIVSAMAFMIGRRLREISMIAEAPMASLQDRLATDLGMDELRMIAALRSTRPVGPSLNATTRAVYTTTTMVALLLGAVAALYAWLGH